MAYQANPKKAENWKAAAKAAENVATTAYLSDGEIAPSTATAMLNAMQPWMEMDKDQRHDKFNYLIQMFKDLPHEVHAWVYNKDLKMTFEEIVRECISGTLNVIGDDFYPYVKEV